MSKVIKSVLKIKISSIISFILILFFQLIFAFILIYMFENKVKDTVMKSWSMSNLGWTLQIGIFIIINFILSSLLYTQRKDVIRPSDFFIIFYCIFVVSPFSILHPVTGLINDEILFFSTIILLLPLFFIILIRALPTISFQKIELFKYKYLICFLLLITFFTIFITLLNYIPSSSFDLDSTANKRIESRAIYSEYFYFGYMLNFTYNALLPYLAFKSGLKKNKISFFFIFLGGIYFFYIFGIKSIFVYIILSFFLGFTINDKIKIKLLGFYFLGILFLLGFLLFIMGYFFNSHTLIADYFFRRIFIIQAQTSSYYLDFFFNNKVLNWSFLTGFQDSSFQYTYYIGDKYYNNPLMNVNSNTFVSKLIEGGFLSYTYSLLIISFFLYLLDGYWKSTQNLSFLFIGFLFSGLVIEQSVTVVFFSSGVLLLFLLSIFEKVEHNKNYI